MHDCLLVQTRRMARLAPAPALVGAIAALTVTCAGLADTFLCQVVAPSSASNVGQLQLPLSGTFIGDYDATTNPGGTQTRPGLFGGSGNVPINYTSSIVGDAGFATVPIGAFTLELAKGGGTITGLELDVTGGEPQGFEVVFNINYQTFRTFNPNSTFPGGFTIPIPLTSGEVTALTIIQTEAAALVLGMPDAEGTPFTAAVPVEVLLQGDAAGAPIGGKPQPAVLPLVGRFTVSGSSVVVTTSLSIPTQTAPIEGLPPIESQPFPLPTVLPAGSTANLLLSGTFGTGSFTSGLSANLVAEGTRVLRGDVNGDGVVNATDLGTLLAAWGSSQASCDLDGNGTVNGVDLAILLTNWS
jgi:hypothetical protein